MTSNDQSYGLEFSLNYIDYELYSPTSFDQRRCRHDSRDSYFQTVPIVRIFGRTEAGQHVCALVHGCFPYMYIEYDGELDEQSVELNCLKLHQNINVTLSTTYRRNPHDDSSTFVADIVLCKAVPFYGLYAVWRPYYKISLLSPKHMSRLADLFRSGSILGRPHQPYESHVPYLLQFMIDYNLYGCNLVRCDSARFRHPVPAPVSSVEQFSNIYSDGSVQSLNGHVRLSSQNVPVQFVVHGSAYARKSRSDLEVDVLAGSILNRRALIQRAIHHDIDTEGSYRPDPNERLLPSLTELWRDDTRRREAMGLNPSRSQLPQSNVRQRSNVWNNEHDMKESLDAVLKDQAAKVQELSFKDNTDSLLERMQTSFESIGDACSRHAVLVFENLSSDDFGRPPAELPDLQITSMPDLEATTTIEPEDGSEKDYRPKHSANIKEAMYSCLRHKTDLKLDVTQSDISLFLSSPMRLRGGDDQGQYCAHAGMSLVLTFGVPAPHRSELTVVCASATSRAFPEPFYSDVEDVPLLGRDYAVNGMMPKSLHTVHLPPFFASDSIAELRDREWSRLLQYGRPAPSRQHLATSPLSIGNSKRKTQISQPTQMNGSGATQKPVPKLSDSDVPLSVLSLEILAQSQGVLLPNPAHDPICAVFWAFQDFGMSQIIRDGCIISSQTIGQYSALKNVTTSTLYVDTELELVQALVELVMELDPDALLSFEMQNSSLGYVEERTKATFSFSALNEMGRLLPIEKDDPGYTDRWGETHATSVKVSGRHVLNLWRIMRSEMNLLQYTLENVAFHQLRLRIPKYSHTDLYRWFSSNNFGAQQRVIKYFTQRTRLNVLIIDSQGLLSRVSEQARLLGIDFYSVFSRGSQFKVESLMCRIAKPECYILLSPSKKQVAQQNALECLPLVMEPQSRFYHDPVLVLDFQSLYPSIMIAYNFCYSTCLGKLGYKGLESKLGVTHYTPDFQTMQKLSNDIEIAPNGVLYVKDHRRKSLLAKMLHDLLETRAMVKEGMKLCKQDKAAQKLMHNRQLALKLIANVTYGYTSASFSGRMPCADIADSIVQTGRETLEKAIEFIHNHPTWNAEVVYGDTDSLFVKLPGRTKDEAFVLGSQMAQDITKMSPTPVKLKFEKVYLPCILLAKKRYVGFKYESPQDVEPVFDAKGIETVRRDGTPAEQKIEENALKVMFRTGNLSAVKDFFQKECWKIMTGRCSLHDFCFAKEVKLGSYSTKGVPPPGAVISAKNIASDPRSEPQYGERVSYLVISGASRSRLTDRCVPPEELLLNPDLRLDVEYYITKNIIPPLDRLFCLMGVNVRSWYDEMPRYIKYVANRANINGILKTSNKIETFLASSHCPVCNQELPKPGVCQTCLESPEKTYYDLQVHSAAVERTHRNLLKICSSCCLVPVHSEIACVSKDCPIYYKRISVEQSVDINMAARVEPLFSLAADSVS